MSPLSTAQLLRQANQPQEVTLPNTGLTVQVKPFNLHEYIRHGYIPNALQTLVQHLFQHGVSADEMEQDPASVLHFMDIVILASLVSPQAVAEPELASADTVYLGDLPPQDRLAIFNEALRPMQERLANLRPLSAAASSGN